MMTGFPARPYVGSVFSCPHVGGVWPNTDEAAKTTKGTVKPTRSNRRGCIMASSLV
jgi:hypothetical protein